VPGLSPEFAAYGATLGELILPILLVFGLFSRFAAVGILIMTAIIELTYIHSTDHILWAFLAASILIKGAGMFSADYWLVKFLRKE
jgi:putative oxidoreductase